MSLSSKNKTPVSIMNDRIEQAIDAKKHQMRDVLKEVEKNFQTSIQGHIDYHTFLLAESKKKGDIASAVRHQVLIETYEGILRNYSMSNSYDNV